METQNFPHVNASDALLQNTHKYQARDDVYKTEVDNTTYGVEQYSYQTLCRR